jgi:hypothetical protein
VTCHGVWMGNQICFTLIQLFSLLHKCLSNTDYCYLSRSSLLYLETSSNGGRSSAPGLTSSQVGGHQTNLLHFWLRRLTTLHRLTGLAKSKSKLYYDRQSVGQSILVSGTHLGPATNFSPSLFLLFLDSFGFVDVGRPLWREVGSVLFSFCRASPGQPLSDLESHGTHEHSLSLFLRHPVVPRDITSRWIQQKKPLTADLVLLHDVAISADPQRTPLVTLPGMTYSSVASLLIVP